MNSRQFLLITIDRSNHTYNGVLRATVSMYVGQVPRGCSPGLNSCTNSKMYATPTPASLKRRMMSKDFVVALRSSRAAKMRCCFRRSEPVSIYSRTSYRPLSIVEGHGCGFRRHRRCREMAGKNKTMEERTGYVGLDCKAKICKVPIPLRTGFRPGPKLWPHIILYFNITSSSHRLSNTFHQTHLVLPSPSSWLERLR